MLKRQKRLTLPPWEGVFWGLLPLFERLRYHLRLMRTFIHYMLCLLIAALPLHGNAVAVMSCSADAMGAQAVMQHHVVAEAATAPEHAHCGHASTKQGGAHGSCSHCASCCVGASAPPAVPALCAPQTFSTIVSHIAEPAMTAYIPATLERPPRR